MGSRPFGLFLLSFLHSLFLFPFLVLLVFLWGFSLALYFSIWQFLLWAFVGSSLDLRGLVLFVSYLSHGHHSGFHFFSFVRGLRGVEPSSLLWGQSFLYWFLITETQNTFRFRWPYIAARWKKAIHFFFDIASGFAPL